MFKMLTLRKTWLFPYFAQYISTPPTLAETVWYRMLLLWWIILIFHFRMIKNTQCSEMWRHCLQSALSLPHFSDIASQTDMSRGEDQVKIKQKGIWHGFYPIYWRKYIFAYGNIAMKSLNHKQNLYQNFMLSTTCGTRGRKGQATQVFIFWRSIQMCTVVNDTCSNINSKLMTIITKEGNRKDFFFLFSKWYLQSKVLDSHGFLEVASGQVKLD